MLPYIKLNKSSGLQPNSLKINSFGPIIEEGMIIGFSILALLIIISIIITILNWSQGLVDDLISNLGG
ncbi:MAG: hypothetical protein ACTSYF_00025 [Promethearchaeota archaeon]